MLLDINVTDSSSSEAHKRIVRERKVSLFDKRNNRNERKSINGTANKNGNNFE
jgi:hypothetical protein